MNIHFAFFALSLLSSIAMADTANGKMLFKENCAICHGQTGRGASGPRLVGDASKWKGKLFERAVLEGIDDNGKALKAPMPHWKNASFKSDMGMAPSIGQVDAIQRYLKSQK